MRDFLLAPISSLVSLKFYKRCLNKPLTTGFAYLAYLSLIFSLGSVWMFHSGYLPVTEELVTWLGAQIPEVVFTREGVRMANQNPLLLSHPQWGPLVYLDPTRDLPHLPDSKEALVVIARTSVAYRSRATNDYQIQNVKPAEGKEWRNFTVTGKGIVAFWRRIRPFFEVIFFIFSWIGIYLWKIAAGFFYSLWSLALNRFRKERLSYRCLLNVTFFSLTPVTVLQILNRTIPGWRIPFFFVLALVITGVYSGFGILGTQEKSAGNRI